jgi:hypothetical protein
LESSQQCVYKKEQNHGFALFNYIPEGDVVIRLTLGGDLGGDLGLICGEILGVIWGVNWGEIWGVI